MVHFLKSMVVTNKGRLLLQNTALQYHVALVPRYCSLLQVAGRGPYQQSSWIPSTGHHGSLGVYGPPFEKP